MAHLKVDDKNTKNISFFFHYQKTYFLPTLLINTIIVYKFILS